jgi:cytochrome c biogenesis protein CcdA
MDGAALTVAVGAGIASSVGPCTAPRSLAILAATTGQSAITRARITGTFLGGALLGYWLVANVAAIAARALSLSPVVYGGVAAILLVSGLVALFRADRTACAHAPGDLPNGAMFLLGLTTSLVVSPCCTPTLAALGMLDARDPFAATLLVAGYGAGHLAPVVLAAAMGSFRFIKVPAVEANVVAAGLTIALGCYYVALA